MLLPGGRSVLTKAKKAIILLLAMVTLTGCTSSDTEDMLYEDKSIKRTLTIELVQRYSGNNIRLNERILQFDAERSDIEIDIRSYNNYPLSYSPWMPGRDGRGNPPDIIELTPNQMKLMFHHGKLEPLNLVEPQYRNYTISSPDGYVIGLKSKVNPLIVYYNKDTFARLGLEIPSDDWDWNMFDDTVASLKSAGEGVYIVMNKLLLEWVTINGYGGRFVDASGTVFSGYMDSEQAIEAAEWLSWIDSDPTITMIPFDLIDEQIALGVDYAFDLQSGGTTNYEAIIRRNDRIGIAPLPGGPDRVNIAKMTGLGIHSAAQNKDVAMELIRYLAEGSEDFYVDTIQHTYENFGSMDPIDRDRLSIVIGEVQHSIPAAQYMYDGQNHGRSHISYQPRSAIKSGQPIEEVLRREAESIDMQFVWFKEDLENLAQCIQQFVGVCEW